MKYIFLCSLFMFLCCASIKVFAEDRTSPAKEAYDRAVAKQATKKELEHQKWLQAEQSRKEAEKEQADIDTQREAAEKVLKKECGTNYKQVRVGMKLPLVQKCVGEFFLQGQVKRKEGYVSYYTRGDGYLYVKNGRVVAWGN